MRTYFFLSAAVGLIGSLALALWLPPLWIPFAIVLGLSLLGVHDVFQRKHAVLRNFPVIGHFRYLLEIDRSTEDNPRFMREKVIPGKAYLKTKAYKNRFGKQTGRWLPYYASGFCSSERAEDARSFFEPRLEQYPGAERSLAQTLEGIALCSANRTAQLTSVKSFLEAQ